MIPPFLNWINFEYSATSPISAPFNSACKRTSKSSKLELQSLSGTRKLIDHGLFIPSLSESRKMPVPTNSLPSFWLVSTLKASTVYVNGSSPNENNDLPLTLTSLTRSEEHTS